MSQTSFEQTWRKRFERFADFDNDAKIAGWSEHSLQTRINVFKQYWHPGTNCKNWLDIGCGAGTYTQILLDNKQKVTAIDYSYPTLTKAKKKLTTNAYSKNLDLGTADVRQLPFVNNSMYGVLCFGVLQALEQPMLAIDEIHNVLQPEGELWLDALNRRSLRFFVEWIKHKITKKPYRLTYISALQLVQYLNRKDYQDIEIIWMPIFPKKYQNLQNKLSSYIHKYGKKYNCIWQLVCHAYLIKAKRKAE